MKFKFTRPENALKSYFNLMLTVAFQLGKTTEIFL